MIARLPYVHGLKNSWLIHMYCLSHHDSDYMALSILMNVFPTPRLKVLKIRRWNTETQIIDLCDVTRRKEDSRLLVFAQTTHVLALTPLLLTVWCCEREFSSSREGFGKYPFAIECDAVPFQSTTARRERFFQKNERKWIFPRRSNNSLFRFFK